MPNRNGCPIRARQRDRLRRQRHRGLVNMIKAYVFQTCATCDREFEFAHAPYFHFDHIDPATKRGEVLKVLHNHGFRAMLEELPKVQLLCRPCHVAKTQLDQRAKCA